MEKCDAMVTSVRHGDLKARPDDSGLDRDTICHPWMHRYTSVSVGVTEMGLE